VTNTPEAVLLDTMEVGERMRGHLERSHQQISELLPITKERVESLSNEEIDELDLYLSRFGKLQDFIASKLFRAIARASLEDTSRDVSLLDTLHRMEKFGVIESTDTWADIRLLRNAFAHEYLTDPQEIAENINGAWQGYNVLISTLNSVRDYYHQHIKPPAGSI
jgi:hypothetical protein